MNLEQVPKALIAAQSHYSPDFRNKLLKVAIALTQECNQQTDYSAVVEKVSSDFNVHPGKVAESLGLYIAIIKSFLQLTDKEFNKHLQDIGFGDEFVNDLPLVNNRQKIVESMARVDSSTSVTWRIDISLYNSNNIGKKVPTSIIIQITLKNGQKYTLSMDISMFHKLRFNVALILKKLNA